MLGRLEMSVEECIEAYRLISEDVFVLNTAERWWRIATPFGWKAKLRPSYDAKKLEDHIKRLVEKHLDGNPDAEMRDKRPGACKVAVVAMATENSEPQVLPSYYDSRNNMMEGMKIWEAARATSAATGFFEPITIGPHKLKFVDGATGANNPVRELWQQAQRQFPSDYDLAPRLGCLLSLGTGLPSQKEWTGNAISVGKRLVEIATDTRRTAEMFGEEHVNLSEDNRYVRLDPLDVGDLKLDAAEDLSTIARRTDSYLQKRPQWPQVLGIAAHLRALQSTF